MLILYWIETASKQVKSVNFDVVTSETHESAMAITQHPVEEGADIVDNARAEPKKLHIEGYVSNKPLFSNMFGNLLNTDDFKLLAYQQTQLEIPKKQGGAPIFTPGGLTSAVTGAIGSLINGPPPSKATVLRSAGGDFPNRARLVYERLETARQNAELITAVTVFGSIPNLLIAKNTVPRTTEDGNGAKYQVELQQVRIVKSKTVTAPSPAESRAKKETAEGSKNTKNENEKGKKVLKSALASTMDAGEGALGALNGLIKKPGGL
jgi:hypothetical protein